MKKVGLLAAVTAAMTIGSIAHAADAPPPAAATPMPAVAAPAPAPAFDGKCVFKVDAVNVVAEKKGDCGTAKHSCNGKNVAENGVMEADAWLKVEKKEDCDKLKEMISRDGFTKEACEKDEKCKSVAFAKDPEDKEGKKMIDRIDFAAVKAALEKRKAPAMPAPAVTAPATPAMPAAHGAPEAPKK